jgi:hypothetical protein
MLRSPRREGVHHRGGDVFLRAAPRHVAAVWCTRSAAARRPRPAARTIVVQDAVRPHLTGDDAINCRDFHKVFHNLCGSISGTDA